MGAYLHAQEKQAVFVGARFAVVLHDPVFCLLLRFLEGSTLCYQLLEFPKHLLVNHLLRIFTLDLVLNFQGQHCRILFFDALRYLVVNIDLLLDVLLNHG